MYPGTHARERAGQAAFIMASTGQGVSYAEYEARTNRLAHLLRAPGLGRLAVSGWPAVGGPAEGGHGQGGLGLG
jgi:hypothetical protein